MFGNASLSLLIYVALSLAVIVVLLAGAVALVRGPGGRRAAAARDTAYRDIAERAVAGQEATERRLGELHTEFAVMNRRVEAVERILKDAE